MDFQSGIFSKRHITEFSVLVAVSLLLLNPMNISFQALTANFTPENIKTTVQGLGVLAPIGMIFLEWLQVVAAPLPPVTMVASGFTFGLLEGGLYSWIGMSLGSFTAILLGRKFGRPLVEKVVSEDHLEKFHELTKKHGLIVFTVIFVAPGFPDDVVCYLAGLTDIDLKKLMLSASLGRIPTVVTLVFTGNSIALAQPKLMLTALGLFIGTSAICIKKEKEIIEAASRAENYLEHFLSVPKF